MIGSIVAHLYLSLRTSHMLQVSNPAQAIVRAREAGMGDGAVEGRDVGGLRS